MEISSQISFSKSKTPFCTFWVWKWPNEEQLSPAFVLTKKKKTKKLCAAQMFSTSTFKFVNVSQP